MGVCKAGRIRNIQRWGEPSHHTVAGDAYTVHLDVYLDYYNDFIDAWIRRTYNESAVRQNIQRISAEIVIDFTYSINVHRTYNINAHRFNIEPVSQSLVIPLTEIYNITITDSPGFEVMAATSRGRQDDRVQDNRLAVMLGALVFCVVFALCIIVLTRGIKKLKADPNEGRQKVSELLKTHSSIIVDLLDAPDLTKYSVLRVREFNDMMTLADTLSRPIMVHRNEEEARFVVTSEGYAYCHTVSFDGDGR